MNAGEQQDRPVPGVVVFSVLCVIAAFGFGYFPADPDVAASGVAAVFACFVLGLLFLAARDGWTRQKRCPFPFGRLFAWILLWGAVLWLGAVFRPALHDRDFLRLVCSLLSIAAIFSIAGHLGALAALLCSRRG